MNMTLKERVENAMNAYSNLKARTGPIEPTMALLEWHTADKVEILGLHIPEGTYMGDAVAQAVKAMTSTEGKPEAVVFSSDVWVRSFPGDTDPESIEFQPGDWGKQLEAGDMSVEDALSIVGVTPIETMAVERRYRVNDHGHLEFADPMRAKNPQGPVYEALLNAVRGLTQAELDAERGIVLPDKPHGSEGDK